jgi:hypothetical protein
MSTFNSFSVHLSAACPKTEQRERWEEKEESDTRIGVVDFAKKMEKNKFQ